MQKNSTQNSSTPAVTVTFMLLCVMFTVCLIVSNLIEIKTIDLGWFTITAGVLIFPFSYIINDCVVEVYGFRRARLMIWTGFGMSLFTTIMLQLAIALPGGAEWNAQDAMESIYGSVPRIMFASFTAFLCGSMINAWVMSRMKAQSEDTSSARSFSVRALLSTIWGESVDSVIFFPIAFAGILEWSTILSLIITQALAKTAYEAAILPVTIRLVRRLKSLENMDTVDSGISYSWWKFDI